jgi:hypothetical protein
MERYSLDKTELIKIEDGKYVLFSDHSSIINSIRAQINAMRAYLDSLEKYVEKLDNGNQQVTDISRQLL